MLGDKLADVQDSRAGSDASQASQSVRPQGWASSDDQPVFDLAVYWRLDHTVIP